MKPQRPFVELDLRDRVKPSCSKGDSLDRKKVSTALAKGTSVLVATKRGKPAKKTRS